MITVNGWCASGKVGGGVGKSWKRIENLKASQYQSVIITAFRELVNRLDKPK